MKKLLIAIFCVMPFLSRAQTLTACRDIVKGSYNFWFYEPANGDSATTRKPLIIFLHGQSLSGNSLSQVLHYGTVDAIRMGRPIDAFVLAPQKQKDAWQPSKILDLLEWATARYAIDTARVYVVGMSAGGYGTINFVGTYPEKVAAAMALCGGGSLLSSYCGLTKVPLWIIHGTADRAVTVAQSHKVVDAMKACGDTTLLRFDQLKGVNHSRLARFFYWEKTYEWLFAHSLNDSVKTVSRDFSAALALKEAYRNFDRTAQKNTVIDSHPEVKKAVKKRKKH
ncbi:carboxylesterase family protein [Dysgonomonas termitidis]|uniref:Prolyl oligopeptidase family serine peptidase n=1 Tax=Dysgonomonas termitidis TaxID=1516126 RepID=A0ABV9KWT0_9BACT